MKNNNTVLMCSAEDGHRLLKKYLCFGYDNSDVDAIIGTYGLKDYHDLYRICGLVYGTGVWESNMEQLLGTDKISRDETICFREDITEYLVGLGMLEERAHYFSEAVRKGAGRKLTEKDIDELRSLDVPQWYIDSWMKIRYLLSRDIGEKYSWIIWRLLYINYLI